jgi:hypothetical protein
MTKERKIVGQLALGALLLPITGCMDGSETEPDTTRVDEDESALICADCEPGGGEPPASTAPLCSSACSATADCQTACKSSSGSTTATTCGSYGICRSCSTFCSAGTSCGASCRANGAVTSCGGYGTCASTYCGYPVALASRTTKNHEHFPSSGWAYGYTYFVEAGTQKTGYLPYSVGRYPTMYFQQNVFASNFQGAWLVSSNESNPRPGTVQFEQRYVYDPDHCYWNGFTTVCPPAYGIVDSYRKYPLVYAKRCSTNPALGIATLSVKEHDPGGTDDEVGKFDIDLGRCQSQVFGAGVTSGWTSAAYADGYEYDADVDDNDTIAWVSYKLWCYRCANGGDCKDGVDTSLVSTQPPFGVTEDPDDAPAYNN